MKFIKKNPHQTVTNLTNGFPGSTELLLDFKILVHHTKSTKSRQRMVFIMFRKLHLQRPSYFKCNEL